LEAAIAFRVALVASVTKKLGAEYLLALSFSQKIARLLGSHVEAKRYLCAIDSENPESLSEASKKS
jgi:predicted HD phosphohydrolase